jgi:tetratricopeptide (TPR) repeat protein
VDGRERWQALQSRLTAARAAADRGDRERALAEITAALDLDPDFLAAHSLRERLLAADAVTPPAPTPAPAQNDAPSRGVSADSYAKFQDRAKQRRLDGRIAAARAAIASGRLHDAAAALDEVIQLDPRLPELSGLTADFDALRRAASPRRGRWLAAGAAFAATILAASWLQDSAPLVSRPMMTAGLTLPAAAPIVPPPHDSFAVATAGTTVATDLTVDVRPEPAEKISAVIPTAAVPELPAAAPAAPFVPHVDRPDDSSLVNQTLQRYRRAYEVSEPQALTFDACDVQLRADTATAICPGSARTWVFTLRKDSGDWKIDSARVER